MPNRVPYVGWILDLSNEATVGVDKTASRCGQRYLTVFLHMQRKQEPAIFAVPGHGKNAAVSETLERHAEAVVRRWISVLTNVRLEGMTGLFGQAKTT